MSEEEQKCYGRELTTEEWLAVGRQAADAGMIYLLLTGGEPMIRPDFIKIYTEMVKMGVLVSVNTNATCVTPEIIDCFRQYKPEAVNVTLYGSSAETYRELCGSSSGWQKAIRGVSMLREAGIRVNLNTTFTRLNIHNMDELISFAKENNLPIRTAAYVFPKVRNGMEEQNVSLSSEEHGKASARFDFMTMNKEAILRKRNQIRKCISNDFKPTVAKDPKASSCMAGRGAFWICWDGKMYPCGMLPDDRYNVRETDFSACWNAISERMPNVFLPAECSGCRYAPICPVCAALTQSLGGDTAARPTEMCRYIEAYSQALLKLTDGLDDPDSEDQVEGYDDFDSCIL